MAIDSSSYDIIYGRLLRLNYSTDKARQLTSVLYSIATNLNMPPVEILQYVTANGIKFDNAIYEKLNNYRTNSSQIGFLNEENIPLSISSQLVDRY